MIQIIAPTIVLISASFLFILACLSFFSPKLAVRFLGGFASSAKTHYLEMTVRLIVGLAFIFNANNMLYSNIFLIFGWILVGSTVILLLLPWQWHHRYGQKIAYPVIRHVWLIGIGSLMLSAFIFFAALKGSTSNKFQSDWIVSVKMVN